MCSFIYLYIQHHHQFITDWKCDKFVLKYFRWIAQPSSVLSAWLHCTAVTRDLRKVMWQENCLVVPAHGLSWERSILSLIFKLSIWDLAPCLTYHTSSKILFQQARKLFLSSPSTTSTKKLTAAEGISSPSLAISDLLLPSKASLHIILIAEYFNAGWWKSNQESESPSTIPPLYQVREVDSWLRLIFFCNTLGWVGTSWKYLRRYV